MCGQHTPDSSTNLRTMNCTSFFLLPPSSLAGRNLKCHTTNILCRSINVKKIRRNLENPQEISLPPAKPAKPRVKTRRARIEGDLSRIQQVQKSQRGFEKDSDAGSGERPGDLQGRRVGSDRAGPATRIESTELLVATPRRRWVSHPAIQYRKDVKKRLYGRTSAFRQTTNLDADQFSE